MACRGVHFAIDQPMMDRVLATESDGALIQLIQEQIEEHWDEEWLQETDKAWDAIHRCLTDGRIGFNNGKFPLNACILGGEQLHTGDEYIVSLVRPEQVAEVAAALEGISQEGMRERYFAIDPDDYDAELNEEDFAYTWEWFEDLPSLFRKAADSGRAVIFSVDQ